MHETEQIHIYILWLIVPTILTYVFFAVHSYEETMLWLDRQYLYNDLLCNVFVHTHCVYKVIIINSVIFGLLLIGN